MCHCRRWASHEKLLHRAEPPGQLNRKLHRWRFTHTRNTAGLGKSCKTQEIPVKEIKSVSDCRSKIPNPSLSYYLPLTPGGNGLGGYHRECLTGWISWRSSVSLKAFNTLDTEIQLIELLGLGQIKVDIYLISSRAIYEQIFSKISLL